MSMLKYFGIVSIFTQRIEFGRGYDWFRISDFYGDRNRRASLSWTFIDDGRLSGITLTDLGPQSISRKQNCQMLKVNINRGSKDSNWPVGFLNLDNPLLGVVKQGILEEEKENQRATLLCKLGHLRAKRFVKAFHEKSLKNLRETKGSARPIEEMYGDELAFTVVRNAAVMNPVIQGTNGRMIMSYEPVFEEDIDTYHLLDKFHK